MDAHQAPDELGSVWVVGSNRGLGDIETRAAHELGGELARHGFGLIVGDWRGVDQIVGTAFVEELQACGISDVRNWVTQIHRTGFVPRFKWNLEGATIVEAGSEHEEFELPAARCGACVVVAGIGGSGESARRARNRGKPVFPLALTEGDAGALFHEIMRDSRVWDVDGVTASQFLLLYTSDRYGVDGVLKMLRAARTTHPHTFVSYRRADAEVAAGRLYADLIESFGAKAVFMDTASLTPGSQWPDELRTAASGARVAVAVIGPSWRSSDLGDEKDWVRQELLTARNAGARVVPLLVGGAPTPNWQLLPDDLRWLGNCELKRLDNDGWSDRVAEIANVIEGALVRRPRA